MRAGPRRAAWHVVLAVAAALALTAASPWPGPPPPAAPAALPAPAPTVATLAAGRMQLTGLQSLSVTGVATAAGQMKVIDLVSQSSTLDGLDLQLPCIRHARVRTRAAQARASGGVSLALTALRVTVLGVPLTLVAADLPEGGLDLPGVPLPRLPTDTLFLSVTMFVLAVTAGAMALDGAGIESSAC